ncbi:glycoside hydrolase family 95 protein [Paenibacillus xylanexedens]|uniref:glycoside hydrolase family 95 protein n=1 Tax=Paenibacillus xylanexedens TaxID=528191 RepID=UPI001F29FCA9|nr:glycoside hydrolase family 95 protein [Paenibacillus xylanexedens]MCF7754122.1 glycoside hydrolase family 95 protein [Paenibacillus xylanexedens]
MNDFTLWYSTPATDWSQGLPLGNGRIGAVVMASSHREVWSMSEVTYWSGQIDPEYPPAGGKAALEEMRSYFFSGDYDEGDRLAKQHLQPKKRNFGTHLGLCEVVIDFEKRNPGSDEAGSFQRELDLTHALAGAFWKDDNTTIRREVYASHADDIVVSRIWSEAPGGVSFKLGLEGGTESFKVAVLDDNTLEFQGQATENVHSDGTCGVWAKGLLKLVVSGGTIARKDGNRLTVTGADEAWIYFSVSTDYRRTDSDWKTESNYTLVKALNKGYTSLREDHIRDYCEQFDKVDIQLGVKGKSDLTTDQRIRLLEQSGGDEDPQLFALFFQYGRYLTIAGSRENSPLPLHLQGIWNDGEACRMGWSCDYHLDVNTQMNYFPTEITNLRKSHLPLFRYIEDLAQAGRETARNVYGCDGWVAHVFSNVWGFTLPGWETSWGLNVTGGLWLAAHLIEHYEYSQDRVFLENVAYPVLKESAAFYLDYMCEHPRNGWLVTGPSNSPENHFYPGNSREGAQQLSMGTTMDQMLVRRLFEFCLNSVELLNKDKELGHKLEEAIGKLPPLQIGKKGQLQEWLEDYEEAQPEHRHLSHMYALYPDNQITPDHTPELSAAVRITLENRMVQEELEDVEFTAALFGLGFARLHDGETAYKHLSHLIGGLCFDNLFTYSKSGIAGAESNIFVVDGNFGGTAVVAEMLLQSYAGEIHLLPALPQAWSTGSITGLRAKGNAEVDIVWENGQLISTNIHTFSAGTFTICWGKQRTILHAEAGESYYFNSELQLVK